LSALPWHWLGRVGYVAGTERQRVLRDRLLAGDQDARCLLLLEHEPVITLGRHARHEHVLASREALAGQGIDVVATDRGGDVTYHGPGQLMIYPVVVLRKDVAGFLCSLAGALAEVAARLGVPGARWQREPAGLWLPGNAPHAPDELRDGAPDGAPDDARNGAPPAKLAACGIHLRRGAVTHGLAFNVSTPPSAWRWIMPCGLTLPVTSVAEERARRGLPPPPPVAEVARLAAPLLCDALASAAR
jgi:lipoyl(octanoyl) transferase